MKISLKIFLGAMAVALAVGGIGGAYYFTLNGGQFQTPSTIVPNSFETLHEGNAALYVCPQDHCSEKLIAFIQSAKTSVHVMIYSFTLDEVANALIDAKKQGLDVKVLMDNTQAGNAYSEDERLLAAGVKVKIMNLPSRHIFHHKVTIVDGKSFSTGSFNYSQNADEGNSENLMMVSNAKMAMQLESAFNDYWSSN